MNRKEFISEAGEPVGPSVLPVQSGRPARGEYAEYAHADIGCVDGDDACEALERQAAATRALFEAFGDAGGGLSYGEGKWTVKEVLGHLADDERIFAYRALCLARGDERELPGFDETLYVSGARFSDLPMRALLDDYLAVRAASLTLFRGLDPEAWLRRGVVNGYAATPRGLAFHIAGHELRHHRVVRERYVPVAEREPWWAGTSPFAAADPGGAPGAG
ncbi:MAG: DinB family protein [Thermoanaerobaculia bacterium]|nr:MAG: DinB family protein [Thermoanaerobaculia bacterium]MBZ0103814.1 DinB family protein [Thermoanaerobaculia bacterium]